LSLTLHAPPCSPAHTTPHPPLSLSCNPYPRLRDLLSFPTRRSSDLYHHVLHRPGRKPLYFGECDLGTEKTVFRRESQPPLQKIPDRKSTRLNSSHVSISYAVFCLKKKRNLRNGHHGTDGGQLCCARP